MNLEDSVLLAIDAFERGSKKEALMHACFAIDGTARNFFSKSRATSKDYKFCLRKNYWLIERFIGEGLDLEETKFTHLKIDNGYRKIISNPDLADIIYHIFRCNHAHGDSVPINFELLPVENERYRWIIGRHDNSVRMPESIIWALLGVAVFCEANGKIKTEGGYELRWGNSKLGITTFLIRDSWGKELELKKFFSDKQQLKVKFKNL